MSNRLQNTASSPCSRHDFIEILEKSCTPKSEWRIGIEHEVIPFSSQNERIIPTPYSGPSGLSALMEEIHTTNPLWTPICEGQFLIGLHHETEKKGISLEPGGQFEVNSSPLLTVHHVAHQLTAQKQEIQRAADSLGIQFLSLGATPLWPRDAIPRVPKTRYHIMAGYMALVGENGLDMMLRSASAQVSLDFESESDMVNKLRLSLALQPLATALFANSPFLDGKLTPWVSNRARFWQHTDPHRTGLLSFAFESGMGFERYIDWALKVPMYCIYRDNLCHDVVGASFSDFLSGKLPGLEGLYPTKEDWFYHLTTLFPEVRLKNILEMRGADSGPLPMVLALAAFWVGLLYSAESREEAWSHVKSWTAEERTICFHTAPRTGLASLTPGGTLYQLGLFIIDIAEKGLKKRGFSEEIYLKPLHAILEKKCSPADHLAHLYRDSWQESVLPCFSTCVDG